MSVAQKSKIRDVRKDKASKAKRITGHQLRLDRQFREECIVVHKRNCLYYEHAPQRRWDDISSERLRKEQEFKEQQRQQELQLEMRRRTNELYDHLAHGLVHI